MRRLSRSIRLPGFRSTVPISIIDNKALQTWIYSVYAQDEWKPIEKLTINYGVRFDLYDGLTRADQASPRVGAVYNLFKGTTLHAAYARYFTPPPTELVTVESDPEIRDHHRRAGFAWPTAIQRSSATITSTPG